MNKIEELEKQAKEILEEIEKLKSEGESKVWKLKENEIYFNIFSWGEIGSSLWNGCEADEERYEMGNCFKTKEEAEAAVKKFKIYTQLKRLAEEINTEPIDWENENQPKFFIGYNHYHKEFLQNTSWSSEEVGTIYSTNKDFKDIVLERIGEENLLNLFKE